MSNKKKKLNGKLKRFNIVLIISLVALMVVLGIVMVYKILSHADYYQVEPRNVNIEKSRLYDSDDYETIGWVRVQGTNIDYPLYGVIQEGYEYPVTDSYLWSLNMDRDYHDTMLVYGHNVLNLGPHPVRHADGFTRMEELMNFVYYDFAKENEYIQLTIHNENYLYKIFAVNFIKVDDFEEYPEGEWHPDDKKAYINRLVDESIYDYDVSLEEDDKIISVVTCSRFFTDGTNYDFIVTGRLVRSDEAIDAYSVRRNKNYERILEILKGAEDDDESTELA